MEGERRRQRHRRLQRPERQGKAASMRGFSRPKQIIKQPHTSGARAGVKGRQLPPSVIGCLEPTQSGRWALPGRRLVIDGMRSSIGHDRQADPRGGDESFGIGEGVDLHRKPVPRTRIVATRIREDLPIHRHAAQNTLRVSSATFASGVGRDHTGVSEHSDCRHSPGLSHAAPTGGTAQRSSTARSRGYKGGP